MMTSGARGEAGADVLESTRMVSMLLYLYENGESRRMEIYNAVGRNNRLPDKLDVLRDMGLVYYGGDNPNRSTIGLTDLGVHVASKLRDIDAAIRTSWFPGSGVV